MNAKGGRSRRPTALLAVALVVVAACTGGQSSSPSPTASAATGWEPQTAWERALQAIDETGHFALEDALTLFATAFGPLPGVAATQDLTGIFDRTIAINAVEAHEAALTDEQRTAIANYLKPPPESVVLTIPEVATARGGAGAADIMLAAVTDERKEELRAGAFNLREIIAGKLGRDMNGTFDIVYTDRPASVQPVLGQYPLGGAHGIYDASGQNSGCRITIFNQATTETDQVLRSLLAHEIFHCFQYAGYGTRAKKDAAPAWVIEGQASWVGQSVGGVSGKYDRYWDEYLLRPTKSLTTRAYDAIGFYSHLDETGTSPWTTFQAMWDAGSNHVAIYKASGADNSTFVDTWASGVLRDPGRGDAWDTTGPGITASAYPPLGISVSDGSSIDVSQPFFTNDIAQLDLNVDLVHFSIDGHGRLSDGTIDTTDLDDVWYCVQGHDCEKDPKCPNAPPVPDTAGTIAASAVLATSGGVDGTVGIVEGRNLDDDKPCDTPRPRSCQSGCGQSNGDPHISTINDRGYDFQAVGEFVLLRSADGSFEVQGRQAPYADSDDVSINTAVAMKLGEHRAGIYVDAATQALRVTVDGAPFDPSSPADLGAGAAIRQTAAGYEVDFPDGSRLSIVWIGYGYGFNILLDPSDAVRASASGLFGPIPDGDSIDLPALPDGTTLPDVLGRQEYWQSLYVTFADAWRVTDATSLFDYAPGESTATFTVREFPAPDDMVTIEDLTPEQIAAGEAACGHIGLELLRQQCIFDVGYTGMDIFSDMYDLSADVIEKGRLTASGERWRVVNLYADAEGGQPLDVFAWADEGAALVATVGYGQASDFFDPGTVTDPFGTFDSQVSVQRRGEPAGEFQLNLFDLPRDTVAGTVRTLVLAPGDPEGFSWVGGRSVSSAELYEARPGEEQFLPQPLDDRGLLVVDTTGLTYTVAPTFFFLSVGDGCLTQPDFPTVPQRIGGGDGTMAGSWLAVPPGEHTLTIHASPDAADDGDCTTPPMHPGTPITIEAGQRAFLLPYATPGDPTIKLLFVPYGQ